jgi:methylated-DNA-[protein]-cysteine S-methyltransferase
MNMTKQVKAATRREELLVESPIGPLLLAAEDGELVGVQFGAAASSGSGPSRVAATSSVLAAAARQLEAYFRGDARVFDLALHPAGTPFQRRVWAVLRAIGYGETVSYAEVARLAGQPSAARAVGRAVGRNPVPIIVPCHRVIGTDGKLTGFAGGLPVKTWLLEHESAHAASSPWWRNGSRS